MPAKNSIRKWGLNSRPMQSTGLSGLCTGLRPYMKRHHLQAGAGHYGVFSGRRWESQVYPLVRNLMLASE